MGEDQNEPDSRLRTRFLSTRTLLAGLGVLAVLFAAYATWRGRFSLTADQWVAFALIPVLVGVVLLALSRARLDVRRNAVMFLVSVGISVYVAELLLLIVTTSPDLAAAAGRRQMWTTDQRVEAIRAMRQDGLDAFPVVPGQVLKTLSLGASEIEPLAPTVGDVRAVLCNEMGDVVAYEADRYGFNNPAGQWAREDVDMVAIGDSYTHGVCVEPGQGLADLLRDQWPSLINVGVMGAGPLTQLGILREYVAPLRPETVVWIFYEGNDLADLREEIGSPVLSKYLDPSFSQDLVGHQAEIDTSLRTYLDSLVVHAQPTEPAPPPGLATLARRAFGFRTIRTVAGIEIMVPSPWPPIGELPEVLSEAARTVQSWDGELVFVYLPAYQRLRSWVGDAPRGRPETLALVEELGLHVIDLSQILAEREDATALWAHPQGHFSVEGYAVVADAIIAGLAEPR